jgi:hypothetical protein
MNDERMDAAIREQAEAHNLPPEPPRDAMWGRIQAERVVRREHPVEAPGRLRWAVWAAGIAATLVIGVMVGRLSVRPQMASNPDTAFVLVSDSGTEPLPQVAAAYQVATGEHLSRVETFLTVFAGEVVSGRVGQADLEMPARQLIRRTRLLRQSPAAVDDVVLRALLDDVEFVLLQIASFAQVGDERELGFVEQGMNQRSVLLRLRSATPSQTARVTSGGAL